MFVYHLVYGSKTLSIFILYMVRQIDKSFHLIGQNEIPTPNPTSISFLKIWKIISQKFGLLLCSFKGDNLLCISLVVLDIEIDKLGFFFYMLICVDIFEYYEFMFWEHFNQWLNIYQQNF